MGAPKYPKNLVDRACKITGKASRTIRRWAKQGLDLGNLDQVLAWSEQKEHKIEEIASPAELEAVKTEQDDARPAVDLKILDRLPAPGEEGAAAALKRLQGLETIFYSRLLAELSQANRPDLVTSAQNDYNKVTESLRKYEAAVEMTRRDLGHLLPKREAENGARAAALWFRLAWRLWLSSAIPDLLPLASDPRSFKQKAEHTFSEILAAALRNSAQAKLSIPEWAMLVIREEFHW
jgi:hypothetical protein